MRYPITFNNQIPSNVQVFHLRESSNRFSTTLHYTHNSLPPATLFPASSNGFWESRQFLTSSVKDVQRFLWVRQSLLPIPPAKMSRLQRTAKITTQAFFIQPDVGFTSSSFLLLQLLGLPADPWPLSSQGRVTLSTDRIEHIRGKMGARIWQLSAEWFRKMQK